jgi:hypothetical protein
MLLLALTALSFLGEARAQSITFKCEERGSGDPKPMSLAYEGEAKGTLKATGGSFGEITLPATRQEAEGQIAIRAEGDTAALMPDKAAMEACIAGKTKPEDKGDADLYTMTLLSCQASATPGAAPVKAHAKIEIVMFDPSAINVFMTRRFTEKSDVPDGYIAIESMPPPNNCMVAR